MRNYKIINIAKYKKIQTVFAFLLFFVFLTPIAKSQTVTSNANITVSVTNGMSAVLIDNSINSINSSYSDNMELLICGVPGRLVVVSYRTAINHLICSLKDKNRTNFTDRGEQQNLSSAGNRSKTESHTICDNNETGKLHLNLINTSESLYNQSQDNNSKDVAININY